MPEPQSAPDMSALRTFDAAMFRFAAAGSFDEQEDETRNMLGALYSAVVAAYGEPSRRTPGAGWESLIGRVDALGMVPGLMLLRHKNVHDNVRSTAAQDRLTDVLTDLMGALFWEPSAEVLADPRAARYKLAERVQDAPVLDSLRAVRAALAPDAPIVPPYRARSVGDA